MSSSPAASEAVVSDVASSPAAATAPEPVLPSIELPNRNAASGTDKTPGAAADDAPSDSEQDETRRNRDKAESSEYLAEDGHVGAGESSGEDEDEDEFDGWHSAAGLKAAKGKGLARETSPLEIRITPLPAHRHDEYVVAPPSSYVRSVVDEIAGTSGEEWYKVEYDDGVVDQISFEELLASENGPEALRLFEHSGKAATMFGRLNKKRKHSHPDNDFDELHQDDFADEDDEIEVNYDEMDVGDDDIDDIDDVRRPTRHKAASHAGKASSRHSTRSIVARTGTESREQSRPARRSLRPRARPASQTRAADDEDELAGDNALESEDENDESFPIIRSDINPQKPKRKRGRQPRVTYRQASIEFEVRRSGRATKATKAMFDSMGDDDSFYVDDDKSLAVPKAVGIKEIFQPVDSVEFVKAHSKTCGTCKSSGPSNSKGILIYCQGCSFAHHKVCLGYRGTRDHRVSKIGPDSFVLQCRFCIGVLDKKDRKAPRHDTCQECRSVGPACREFTPKLSPKQEEKLRDANNGEDPITEVPSTLINNPDNVLFRCFDCKRAFHYLHLARLESAPDEDPADKDKIRADRLDEYSIHHRCKDCLLHRDDKLQTMVAWRPADQDSYENESYNQVKEDDKEYLVKWVGKSYAHCTWMPGAWIFGVSHGTMRASFAKRDDGGPPLPCFTKEDAIPAEYLMADIIFAVRYHSGGERITSREEAMARISKVKEVRVKFQGLSYDEVVWDSPPSRNNRPLWDAFKEAFEEYINGKLFVTVSPYVINERIKMFCKEPCPDIVEQPKVLTPTRRLMTYQIEGINWLVWNFYKMDSVILADEMGLGKTIQVCGMVGYLALQQPKCWPFLIVVPSSTCPNWRREIKQWVPDLRVVCYYGGKVPQETAYKNELFPDGTKDIKAHVVIMSYDSAQDNHTRYLFRNVRWQGLVVDEGQRLKNDQNLLYGALRAMKIPFRVLLTGTPLQNNKRELFNLIQFIDTSKDAAKLDEEYAVLTKENIPELHALIKPYFLRRTKAEVLKFLPPMGQVIVPVTMSVVQEKLCKSIMAKNPQLIRAIFAKSKINKAERGSLNNILMQLRKCLCHPFVYSDAIEDRDLDAKTMQAGLIDASSKLVLLNMMLPKLKEKGHRVLLFSQFLDQLNILEDFLTGLGYQYRRLDGSVTSLERQRRIDDFNAPGSDIFAFLLSTRAGGVGINLATADTVIILDPDFNPHQDIQALSRAHRIGQTKKVLCFQLMTKGSVEEKIMQVGRKKMALDHVMIETMDKEDMEADDLESILKHGAEALFSDSNDREVIKYDDASVEKLLDRSHLVSAELDENDKREREFTLARVWVNEKGALADDLEVAEGNGVSENVWEKLLQERELDAMRLAEKEAVVLGRGGRRRQAVRYSTHMQFDDDGQKSESEQDGDFIANDGEGGSDDEDMRTQSDVPDSDSGRKMTAAKELEAALQRPPGLVGGPSGPNVQGDLPAYGQTTGPNGSALPAAKAGKVAKTRGPKPRGQPLEQHAQPMLQQLPQHLQAHSRPPGGPTINLSPLPSFKQPARRGRPPKYPRPPDAGQPPFQLRPGGPAVNIIGGIGLAQLSTPVLHSNGVAPGGVAATANVPVQFADQSPSCGQCFHYHNPGQGCPINTSSEMALRLAIDQLRASPHARDIQTRDALKAKLRQMKLASREVT